MSRRALLPALLCALAWLLAAPAAGQQAGRQVFSRRDLDAAGVQRLSELLFWLGEGSATVEGVTWIPGLDGAPAAALPGTGLPGWELIVDGQRVEVGALGAWMPELAPTTAGQIDSVVVERAPGVVAGGFASRGVLRIHTRRPTPGPSVRGWVRHGSETGDPGPYIWTPLATPNVDRTGPDAEATVAYAGQRWDAQVSYKRTKHPVTDPRLQQAFGTFELPFLRTGGPSLRLGARALGGRHELLAGQTEQEGAYYVPERRRMELSRLTLRHLGAAGAVEWEKGTGVAYQLSRASLEGPVFAPVAGGHRRALDRAAVELSRHFAAFRAAGGVAAERRTLDPSLAGGAAADAERHGQITAHLVLERDGSVGWRQGLAAAVTRAGGEYAAKAALTARWRASPGRALTASASAARLLPYEGDAWLDARLLRGPAAAVGERSVRWAEVGWRQELGSAVVLDAAGSYGYLDLQGGEAGAARGGRFGARAGLLVRGGQRWHARALYSSVGSFGGTDVLQLAMETVPAHSLRGWASYEPVPGFELRGALLFRSATRWGVPVPPGGGGADARLGAVTRADLAARKWFWNRRLHALLQVQNVLGTPERYHSRGADLALRYFVGVGADLPALR